jgi:hypothetical protein
MYLISSALIGRLSNCCYYATVARDCVTPQCLRDKVMRFTPNRFVTSRYENCSPGSRDSIAAIAASIGSILMKLRCVEVRMMHLF